MVTDEELASAGMITVDSTTVQTLVTEIKGLRSDMQQMREEISGLKAQVAANPAAALPRADEPLALPPPPPANAPVPLKKGKSSFAVRDPFFAAALKRAHPMYVVRISTLLAPSFQRFRPHEELRASGMLVEWTEGMGAVLFCSHTWLRNSHPDSAAGEKFTLLTGLLRKIQSGKLDVYSEAMISMLMPDAKRRLRLKAADLQRELSDGYVFFDYMSIPQADPEAQQRAVISLGSYVSASSYFFCLAGPWHHENGSIRDDIAWQQRGWCRMELVANALSPTPKPMVLAKSIGFVEANAPGGKFGRDWITYAIVGKGDFSVEADRAKLGHHLQEILAARKALALADKDMLFYRMLHALTPYLTDGCGLERELESYDAWMSAMRFASVTQDAKTTGMTPLFYAVMAGRVDIAETLLEQGAQVNVLVKISKPELTIAKGCNELHYAVWFQHGGDVTRRMVQLLIKHGVDTRRAMPGLGIQPIMGAAVSGNLNALEALVDHDKTLGLERDFMGFPCYMVPCNAPNGKMALEFMREQYPEQFAQSKERLSPFGMTYTAQTIGSGGHVDMVKMLLDDEGEQINRVGPVMGTKAKMMTSIASMLWGWQRNKQAYTLTAMLGLGHSVTPMFAAAMTSNLGALEAVLERGGDVNVQSGKRRMAPLHVAALYGHDQIAAKLIEAGAVVTLKDKTGRTPIDWAKRNKHDEVTQLLLAALRTSTVQEAAGKPSARGGSIGQKALSSTGLQAPAQVAPNPREL